jgi:hypothetical protein
MTQFDSDFVAAGADPLLAVYGEAAQVRDSDTAAARDVTVIIDRSPPAAVPGTPDGWAPFVDAWVKVHATEGAASITVGKTGLYFPPRRGGTSDWYRVQELIEQDGGFWHVRVRTHG